MLLHHWLHNIVFLYVKPRFASSAIVCDGLIQWTCYTSFAPTIFGLSIVHEFTLANSKELCCVNVCFTIFFKQNALVYVFQKRNQIVN